jgi:hypothetical protein
MQEHGVGKYDGPPGKAGRRSQEPFKAAYATFTSMAFGFAFSDFGRWRLRTHP